uniref:O-methyltransferase C-terminal domain-containing protein n=1 Tax=Zea mays TaxID=4577 RepID=A0A804NLH5_MAIZE
MYMGRVSSIKYSDNHGAPGAARHGRHRGAACSPPAAVVPCPGLRQVHGAQVRPGPAHPRHHRPLRRERHPGRAARRKRDPGVQPRLPPTGHAHADSHAHLRGQPRRPRQGRRRGRHLLPAHPGVPAARQQQQQQRRRRRRRRRRLEGEHYYPEHPPQHRPPGPPQHHLPAVQHGRVDEGRERGVRVAVRDGAPAGDVGVRGGRRGQQGQLLREHGRRHPARDAGRGPPVPARVRRHQAVVAAFPHIQRCTVMDLPHVVAEAPAGTAGLSFHGGDMFEHIPSADALMLKWILHDWDEDKCIKIMERCKEAIGGKEAGGKVIIIDTVLGSRADDDDDDKTCRETYVLDLHILSFVNGAEREEHEWRRIFLAAGFRDYKITHTRGIPSIIEVFP